MIRFPRVHIAQSVVNAIRDVADNIALSESAAPTHAPAVPDPSVKGAELDAALGQGQPAVSTPQGAEPGMLEAALQGSSPLDAAVSQEIANNG